MVESRRFADKVNDLEKSSCGGEFIQLSCCSWPCRAVSRFPRISRASTIDCGWLRSPWGL
jgi:hypothetical protein